MYDPALYFFFRRSGFLTFPLRCTRRSVVSCGIFCNGVGHASSAVVTTHWHCDVALCESKRLLFENKKTFAFAFTTKLHPDDMSVVRRNEELFSLWADGEELPGVAELDRVLPSARQLRDEIPSAAAVEEAMRRGADDVMWAEGTAEDDGDV